MAIPADPTIKGIVEEALKRGGRFPVQSSDIRDATDNQFQEVKSDLRRPFQRHPLLETTKTVTLETGIRIYDVPEDYNILVSFRLVDPDTSNRTPILVTDIDDPAVTPTSLTEGIPAAGYIFNQKLVLTPTPDKDYNLVWRYYSDIELMDEDSDRFITILREWRSLWVQGVTVKTMQRFDDERYQLELQVYGSMLGTRLVDALTIVQVQYQDV